MKELEENVMMLENGVKNRDIKIISLTEELKSFEASKSTNNLTNHCKQCGSDSDEDTDRENKESSEVSTSRIKECDQCEYKADVNSMDMHVIEMHEFSCELCDYKTKTEDGLTDHTKDYHEVACEQCGERFIGLGKLRRHFCRKHVSNPEYLDMYVKNWFRPGDCIPVFSRRLQKEIVILHSEGCWKKDNFCCELPDNVDENGDSILDDDGLLHGPAKKSGSVREDGSMCWLAVQGLMINKMDWYKPLTL